MNKPEELRIIEGKQLLINTVNALTQQYNLSFTLVDQLMQAISYQISVAASKERQDIADAWQKTRQASEDNYSKIEEPNIKSTEEIGEKF